MKLKLLIVFTLLAGIVSAQTNLVSYEYWFNDDYDNVQIETISPAPQHELNKNIDVTFLPNYVNVLNVRYKDENGNYSSTFSKFFLKLGDTETPETPETNNLVSYEYWFNEDYANVHIETISPTAQHILNTNIDITDLPDNLNVLNIRYKDENGKYSSTLSKLFVKLSEDHIVDNQIVDNKLTHYMYWFDDDFSNATTVTLPQNVPNHNWVQLLTLPSDMEGGNHKINIRYKDSLNLWSVPFAKTFFKNYYPRAVFNGMENALCFGTMLEVTPNAIDVDSIYWNFGDGTPIEGKTPETLIQHLYDSEGTYNITATMKHLASGVTNDTTFAITVYPNYSSLEVSLSVCESDLPYSFGTQSLTTTGVYTETFQTVYGCDSTVTAHFTVNPVYDNSETVYICSGSDYTFHDDTILNNITESTSHVSHLQTVNGCDSIITTYLYVNPVYDNTETVYICSGSDYTFHDGTTQPDITSDISHVNYLQTVDGCDSIITTYLIVNPVYAYTESFDICSGSDYTFHDGITHTDITSDISYVSHLQSVNGCDSVITTNLIVNPVYDITETVDICSGSDYSFHDGTILNDITENTSHVSHLQSVDGCDSIITTNLIVNPVYANTETVYICSGSDYTFHDGTTQPDITSNISHVSYLQTVNGCDSLITTNLIVNPVYNFTESIDICSGSDYTFHDGTTQPDITSNISHVSYLQTVNGCDSVITTNLIVNPVYDYTETVDICSGSDYTFHDGTTLNDITENTSYVSYLQTVNGCDSVITTNLTVIPSYYYTESFDICSGSDYTFHDGTTQPNITSDISHVSYLQTVNGCDSIITTNLIVNPVYDLVETIDICSGSDYTFHDGTTQPDITSNILHVSYLQTVNGCDSIITTNLIVNPVYDFAESIDICSGSDYTFHDGTTQTNITENISHVSYLQTVSGCDSIITTNLIVNPVYDLAESIDICSGSDYTFHDGTTQTNITENISHVSYLQTVSGCDSIITTNLEVIHIDNTVTQNSNQLIANQINASYQWLNCDDNFSPIIGETNRGFVAQFDGNYAVGITYNNCVDTSDCVFVEVIGIDNDFTDKKVILYPNPAENVLSIKLIGVTANRVDILDVNSKKIKEYYINNEESIINIEDLSIGIYLLRLFENQELIYQSKFVKIR